MTGTHDHVSSRYIADAGISRQVFVVVRLHDDEQSDRSRKLGGAHVATNWHRRSPLLKSYSGLRNHSAVVIMSARHQHRKSLMATKRLWRLITDAFVVEDGPGPGKRLRANGRPRVGDGVDIHFNCTRQLVSVIGQPTTWARLNGEIVKVLNQNKIRVELIGATDAFPKIFPDFWRATLERDPEWKHPWLVTKLEPAQRLHAKISGAEERRAIVRAARRYRAERSRALAAKRRR